MKKICLAAIAAFSLLTGAMVTVAAPSLAGPSGLAVLPDATTTASDYQDFALDYHASDSDAGLDGVTTARATMGLSGKSELGASYRFLRGATSRTNNYDVNYKYASGVAGTQLAVGAQYFFIDEEASGTGNNATGAQFYLAATREMPNISSDVTVGVNYTFLNAGVGVNPAGFRPYAALSVALPQQLKLRLEAQGGLGNLSDSKPLTAISLSRPLGDGYTAQLGMSNLKNNTFGGDNQRPFLGVSYHLYNGLGKR